MQAIDATSLRSCNDEAVQFSSFIFPIARLNACMQCIIKNIKLPSHPESLLQNYNNIASFICV